MACHRHNQNTASLYRDTIQEEGDGNPSQHQHEVVSRLQLLTFQTFLRPAHLLILTCTLCAPFHAYPFQSLLTFHGICLRLLLTSHGICLRLLARPYHLTSNFGITYAPFHRCPLWSPPLPIVKPVPCFIVRNGCLCRVFYSP